MRMRESSPPEAFLPTGSGFCSGSASVKQTFSAPFARTRSSGSISIPNSGGGLFAPRAQLHREARGFAAQLGGLFFERFELFAAFFEPFELGGGGLRVFHDRRGVGQRERPFGFPQRAYLFFKIFFRLVGVSAVVGAALGGEHRRKFLRAGEHFFYRGPPFFAVASCRGVDAFRGVFEAVEQSVLRVVHLHRSRAHRAVSGLFGVDFRELGLPLPLAFLFEPERGDLPDDGRRAFVAFFAFAPSLFERDDLFFRRERGCEGLVELCEQRGRLRPTARVDQFKLARRFEQAQLRELALYHDVALHSLYEHGERRVLPLERAAAFAASREGAARYQRVFLRLVTFFESLDGRGGQHGFGLARIVGAAYVVRLSAAARYEFERAHKAAFARAAFAGDYYEFAAEGERRAFYSAYSAYRELF